jgi:eukaryotic-like serine/threonine-protein kinase
MNALTHETSLAIEPKDAFFAFARKSRIFDAATLDSLIDLSLGNDLETLLDTLSSQNRLTSYQRECILEGRSHALIIGPYTIFEEIGEGGFGKVFKAFHQIMRRTVALKVIAARFVESRDVRDLFLREVEATTRLSHPNIASAYDANDENGVLYLALEYINGPNLDSWVRKNGPLDASRACAVILQVAEALEYTHERGMLHRDLKPNNILISNGWNESEVGPAPSNRPPWQIKVIDFGLARLHPFGTPQSGTIRQEAELVGTPEFISPEQALDFHKVDIRSDLYSVGCTLYFLLAGRCPFMGATQLQTIAMQLKDEPQPLTDARPDIPLFLASLVRRLMAKKPEDRFQTPTELADALRDALTKIEWQDCGSSRLLSVAQVVPIEEVDLPQTDMVTVGIFEGDSSAAAPIVADNVGTIPVAQVEDPRPTEDWAPALWQEWIAIVETIYSGMPNLLSETEYSTLRSTLLNALRRPPESTPNEISKLYSRMELFVEPWLMIRTLRDLDRRTLAGLRDTCLRYDAELPASAQSHRSGRNGYVALLIAILALTIVGVCMWRHELVHWIGTKRFAGSSLLTRNLDAEAPLSTGTADRSRRPGLARSELPLSIAPCLES